MVGITMNPFKNLTINLHAAGPAAVVVVWLICLTTLGILGSGPMAQAVVYTLQIFGGALISSMAIWARNP